MIAGELANRGRRVLLLEAGPHQTAADYMRWEARANHELWWPPVFAEPAGGTPGPPLIVLRGRCVGGTTAINTKVALRPDAHDYAKWHDATGLLGAAGAPFGEPDLRPHLEAVERRLGVRERADWQQCVRTVVPGFEALTRIWSPSCRIPMRIACAAAHAFKAARPTPASRPEHLYPASLGSGWLELRPGATVTRVVVEDSAGILAATGVEWTDADGEREAAAADIVVVAAGALATPGLLLRSGVCEATGGSASSALIGRHIGFHPARLVEGLFDEIQDAHMVYPISAHCMKFRHDEDGGFVVEAATVQDPIGFATALCNEQGAPLWGEELVQTMRKYRYFTGLLTMVNDENHGSAWVDEQGRDRFSYAWSPTESARNQTALQFARDVLLAAGAKRVLQTDLLSTHVQGGCRMGSDPSRSVVDAHGEMHDVRRLFVGDSSVLPRTPAINPSLTIMALATRLADYLAAGEHGYFARPAAAMAA